jgi:2-succinyl-6-hydroxy-2,4-cyclohexadiene-1-carboxylate synthase
VTGAPGITDLDVHAPDGLRLHLRVAGSGPVVLLLHGFTGSSESWNELSAALHDRFTVAAMDLPGHGHSGAPDDPGRYSLTRLADDVAAVLDALDAPTASVLGYSMGGRAAVRFALAHPDRLDALVLESTSPGITDAEARLERRRADAEVASLLERDGILAFVDQWERMPLWASQSALPKERREALRRQRLAQSARGLALSLKGAGAGNDIAVLDRLAGGGITAPALLVAGALDGTYVEHARLMGRHLPRAQVAIVPDAGHAVHLEQPHAYATLVKRFLEEHSFRRR